jgi:hypothetical protein
MAKRGRDANDLIPGINELPNNGGDGVYTTVHAILSYLSGHSRDDLKIRGCEVQFGSDAFEDTDCDDIQEALLLFVKKGYIVTFRDVILGESQLEWADLHKIIGDDGFDIVKIKIP